MRMLLFLLPLLEQPLSKALHLHGMKVLFSWSISILQVQRVAQLLGRTEGSFQRVCRGLGILRWPYRVRKSLQEIMAKTEEYLVSALLIGSQFASMTKQLSSRRTSLFHQAKHSWWAKPSFSSHAQ